MAHTCDWQVTGTQPAGNRKGLIIVFKRCKICGALDQDVKRG